MAELDDQIAQLRPPFFVAERSWDDEDEKVGPWYLHSIEESLDELLLKTDGEDAAQERVVAYDSGGTRIVFGKRVPDDPFDSRSCIQSIDPGQHEQLRVLILRKPYWRSGKRLRSDQTFEQLVGEAQKRLRGQDDDDDLSDFEDRAIIGFTFVICMCIVSASVIGVIALAKLVF